jgi:hypothetical protein
MSSGAFGKQSNRYAPSRLCGTSTTDRCRHHRILGAIPARDEPSLAIDTFADAQEEAKIRWADSMRRYFAALRQQLLFRPAPTLAETVDEYIKYRFHTVGVLPIFAFVELCFAPLNHAGWGLLTFLRYYYGLRIPDDIWNHPAMAALRETGVKMAMMYETNGPPRLPKC